MHNKHFRKLIKFDIFAVKVLLLIFVRWKLNIIHKFAQVYWENVCKKEQIVNKANLKAAGDKSFFCSIWLLIFTYHRNHSSKKGISLQKIISIHHSCWSPIHKGWQFSLLKFACLKLKEAETWKQLCIKCIGTEGLY